MEPVSTIDPNNEDCNNGLHHTNGGHSTASKGSFDIMSRVLFEKKSDKRLHILKLVSFHHVVTLCLVFEKTVRKM